jgi:hypothetical protein
VQGSGHLSAGVVGSSGGWHLTDMAFDRHGCLMCLMCFNGGERVRRCLCPYCQVSWVACAVWMRKRATPADTQSQGKASRKQRVLCL